MVVDEGYLENLPFRDSMGGKCAKCFNNSYIIMCEETTCNQGFSKYVSLFIKYQCVPLHGGGYDNSLYQKATVWSSYSPEDAEKDGSTLKELVYKNYKNDVVYNFNDIWKLNNRCLMLHYHSNPRSSNDRDMQTVNKILHVCQTKLKNHRFKVLLITTCYPDITLKLLNDLKQNRPGLLIIVILNKSIWSCSDDIQRKIIKEKLKKTQVQPQFFSKFPQF